VKTENLDVDLRGFTTYPWAEVSDKDLVIVTSKNEGDGLVVAEAVILGIPILLLDTPDLRRFELPDQLYRSSRLDFCESIIGYFKNGLCIDKGTSEFQEKLYDGRRLSNIFIQWRIMTFGD